MGTGRVSLCSPSCCSCVCHLMWRPRGLGTPCANLASSLGLVEVWDGVLRIGRADDSQASGGRVGEVRRGTVHTSRAWERPEATCLTCQTRKLSGEASWQRFPQAAFPSARLRRWADALCRQTWLPLQFFDAAHSKSRKLGAFSQFLTRDFRGIELNQVELGPSQDSFACDSCDPLYSHISTLDWSPRFIAESSHLTSGRKTSQWTAAFSSCRNAWAWQV